VKDAPEHIFDAEYHPSTDEVENYKYTMQMKYTLVSDVDIIVM
jgi:hypothetical protein